MMLEVGDWGGKFNQRCDRSLLKHPAAVNHDLPPGGSHGRRCLTLNDQAITKSLGTEKLFIPVGDSRQVRYNRVSGQPKAGLPVESSIVGWHPFSL
jgi:hypothetical protein